MARDEVVIQGSGIAESEAFQAPEALQMVGLGLPHHAGLRGAVFDGGKVGRYWGGPAEIAGEKGRGLAEIVGESCVEAVRGVECLAGVVAFRLAGGCHCGGG